ncbi:MAG: (d)CMP kinase [Sphaerochaetaceae bacterium]|nr:(d)CMP kinase [Sphaerochaetaceae bacterium]MDC7236565.1 (d)CMP kinase [Sphaerochaetaceae bacterium]MDC7243882.1 (d)CMP kinase [Sphaerochaetaceae bacterium]MDC7248724.1 (d)CMP kinase [Sphaerochaetaceae bacterium]
MVVAIDGPAGVGKSTIAALLAEKLNLYYLNSGSFYRAITYAHQLKNEDILNKDAVLETAKNIKISVKNSKVCVDGIDVEDKLHTLDVDKYVSQVSVDPRVRDIVNSIIKNIAEGIDIIAEGRDITTVVFPNADFKFYFDANAEIRAKRRYIQHPDGQDFETILSEIKKRDKNDKEKPVGSLKIANDAIIIDTSYLTIPQVCEKVIKAIKAQDMR